MITQHNSRTNGGEPFVNTFEQTPDEAFESLIVWELGYGGQVTALTRTKVSIRTRILFSVDDTTWTGSEEEMSKLVLAAQTWVQAHSVQEMRQTILDTAVKQSGVLVDPKTGGISPLMLTMAAGFFLGKPISKVCALTAYGVTDVPTVEALAKLGLKDLCALLALSESEKTTPLETLKVLGCSADTGAF